MAEPKGTGERGGDPMKATLPTTPPSRFGAHVRLLRQQFRMAPEDEVLGTLALANGDNSMTLICALLAAHGYDLEIGTYREIEAGLHLPDDPTRFLNALAVCLALSDMDVAGLLWQFAYDLLRDELGEGLARELLLDAARPNLA